MKKKTKEMYKIIDEMKESDFLSLISFLKDENVNLSSINMLQKRYAEKPLIVKSLNSSNKKFFWSIDSLYKNELNKLSLIINDKNTIERIGGLKVLLFGETGTGKTSFVNRFVEINKNFHYKKINLETIISSRLGQTQINVLKLVNDLNIEFLNKKAIVFIDELDSFVNNRISNNDVAEHGRIVSTFIKFIDELSFNISIISATNIITNIDEAVKRRFNVQIKGKKFDTKEFFEFFLREHSEFENLISKRLISDLIYRFENILFNIADLKSFEEHINLEKLLNKENIDLYIEFILFFQNKIEYDIKNFSERTKNKLRKREIHE